jgi:hypothetical protein
MAGDVPTKLCAMVVDRRYKEWTRSRWDLRFVTHDGHVLLTAGVAIAFH